MLCSGGGGGDGSDRGWGGCSGASNSGGGHVGSGCGGSGGGSEGGSKWLHIFIVYAFMNLWILPYHLNLKNSQLIGINIFNNNSALLDHIITSLNN